MQNLIIEVKLKGPAPSDSRLKLMWTPNPAAPFGNFLLVGVDHERLARTLWRVFGEFDAERTGLTTQESFAQQLNFQYFQVGKTSLTPLQASLSSRVVVQVITHNNDMVNAQVRLMGASSTEVVLKRYIKSVTNHIYTPR